MKNILNSNEEIVKSFRGASSRIFFIDYDGTLARLQNSPSSASPTKEMKDLLTNLGSDSRNRIVILSGRERQTLQSWLGSLPVTLAAEHGGFCKEQFDDWYDFFQLPTNWIPHLFSCLRALTFDFSGSFIEQKSYSLVWHYRSIAHTLTDDVLRQVRDAILMVRANDEFELYQEDCALEIRTAGVDKGRFAKKYMQCKDYDFILAIGDGKTDEDLFKAVEKSGYSIKVGESSDSSAKYFIDKQDNVLAMLGQFSNASVRLS